MQQEFSKRPMSEQLALLEQIALDSISHWGLRCKNLSLIKQRENAVYKLLTEDDQLFALRVHRGGYHSDAALLSEFSWMDALESAGIHVPQIIPCTNGNRFAVIENSDLDEPRQIDLLKWIPGAQLGSVEDGLGGNSEQITNIYATIGRRMAQLHKHSSHWQLPEGFTRHAWDEEGLVGDRPFWGRFWDLAALTADQRRTIQKARNVVSLSLAALNKSPANYGMIHADFVPENLLVDGDNIRVIDFDDAGFGWYMFDIATALYFIQDDPNYALAKTALITAYQSERPLADASVATLPLFMVARSFTYLGWVHTRSGTAAAEALTPILISMCCGLAETYCE